MSPRADMPQVIPLILIDPPFHTRINTLKAETRSKLSKADYSISPCQQKYLRAEFPKNGLLEQLQQPGKQMAPQIFKTENAMTNHG